jgi:hypothetical protein
MVKLVGVASMSCMLLFGGVVNSSAQYFPSYPQSEDYRLHDDMTRGAQHDYEMWRMDRQLDDQRLRMDEQRREMEMQQWRLNDLENRMRYERW